MALSTTHVGLPPSAVVLDVSDNGRFVSYSVVADGTDTLYVLDLNSGASAFVASTAADVAHSIVDGGHGIDGGRLSSDGHFIFYSTGEKDGGLTPNGSAQLFVKDLQSAAPPTNVTPSFPVEPFPGTAVGLGPGSISDDGNIISYGIDFIDFTTTDPGFSGGAILNLTTGVEERYMTATTAP